MVLFTSYIVALFVHQYTETFSVFKNKCTVFPCITDLWVISPLFRLCELCCNGQPCDVISSREFISVGYISRITVAGSKDVCMMIIANLPSVRLFRLICIPLIDEACSLSAALHTRMCHKTFGFLPV